METKDSIIPTGLPLLRWKAIIEHNGNMIVVHYVARKSALKARLKSQLRIATKRGLI